jgi:hypothetical protein
MSENELKTLVYKLHPKAPVHSEPRHIARFYRLVSMVEEGSDEKGEDSQEPLLTRVSLGITSLPHQVVGEQTENPSAQAPQRRR